VAAKAACQGDGTEHAVGGLGSAEHEIGVALSPAQDDFIVACDFIVARFKDEICKERKHEPQSFHDPLIAQRIVRPQSQKDGSDVCGIFLKPLTVVYLPRAAHTRCVGRVVELMDDDFLQNVEDDAGRLIVGSLHQ